MLRRTAFALLSALSLLAGAAQAAEPRLEVMPFLGSITRSAWQPFTVTVTNPANSPAFSGEVRLQLTDLQNGYGTLGSWSRPIQLSPGSSTKVTITAGIPYGTLPIAQANLVQGTGQSSRIVASERFDGLRVRPDNTITVLDLSGETDNLNQIDNLATGFRVRGGRLFVPKNVPGRDTPSKGTTVNSRIRVTPLSPKELPEDTLGLNGVTAIYLDKATDLTPQQQQRLDNYVSAGGLLVTGTAGPESITSVGAGVRAQIVAGDIASWRKALHLQATQTGLLESLDYASMGSEYSDLEGIVEIGDGTAPLPLGGLLLFLGIYIVVLVPVQYAVLKRLDKREWAWGVTPALAVVFALAAYGFGQRGRSRESFFNVASIVEMEAGRSTGQALSGIGLFSPNYQAYDMGVKSSGPLSLNTTGGTAESLVNGVPTLRNLSVPMWSIKSTEARSEVTLGQGLEVRPHDNQVTLTNRTGQILHGLRVGSAISVAILRPGETCTVPVPLWKDNGYALDSRNDYDPAAQRMSERLRSVISYRLSELKPLTITAWLDTPVVELELNGKPVAPKHHTALLVVYAPQLKK